MEQAQQTNQPRTSLKSTSQRGKQTQFWIIISLLLFLFAFVVVRLHSKEIAKTSAEQAALANALPHVEVANATTGAARHYLNALGTVTPLNTVLVRSRIDGQIMNVFFHEGELVQEGALLAQIDPRPAEVMLTQATGQMARDQAALAQAETDLQRYEPLAQHKAIAQQQKDDQAALVQQYRGAVEVDAGQIDNAKLQLTYSRITAPISGRIGLRLVDPGNVVHANDTTGIVSITQVRPITVVFNLAEDDLPALQKALRANPQIPVEAWDRANQIHIATGRILSLDNSIDSTSGTLKVKATFENDHGELFPNEFVNVRVLTEVNQNALLVPDSAVQRNGDSAYVYVLGPDNTVHVRSVETGHTDAGKVEILSGLQPGDAIVTRGFDKLQDAIRVTVATANESADGRRESGE